MNIKAQLSKEHTKANALLIADYIGDNRNRFEVLMELFFNSENRMVQRASWVISHVADRHIHLIYPYVEKMVDNLNHPAHNAVKRNTVRIFQDIDIPQELMGKVADKCFGYLENPKEAVAVRVFSMTVLYNICQKEPDLKNELKMLIEDHLEGASAAFKSRGKKILNKLNKKP